MVTPCFLPLLAPVAVWLAVIVPPAAPGAETEIDSPFKVTVIDVGLVGLPAAPEAVVFSEEVTAVEVTIVETVPASALLIIAL